MRAESPIATGTWYHVMSFDITQYHYRTVPELSQVWRVGASSDRAVHSNGG
jgi:hypothetical protein